MGSAVMKPLTRRRGKIKTNDPVVNTPKPNPPENVGNCEPHVDYKIDSLHKPAIYKNVRKKSKSAHSAPRFCINKCTSVKTSNQHDSDEEPFPLELAVKPVTDTFEKGCKEPNIAEEKESPPAGDEIEIPFLPEDCINPPLIPPAVRNTLPTSPTQKACSTLPIAPKNISPNDPDTEVSKTSAKKIEVSDTGLEAEISLEQQDVSRDARTPSPEYDDLEDVKVINPNPLPVEHSLSSPLESGVTNPSAAGDVGVSISKTDQPAPEREGEQRMEVDHVVFIKPSPSKEFAGTNFQAGDDPFQEKIFVSAEHQEKTHQNDFDQMSGHSPVKTMSEVSHKMTTPCTEEPRCMSLSSQGHNVHRNISSSANVVYVSVQPQIEENKNSKEDNTLRSSDSFIETLVSGSNISSSTCLANETNPVVKAPSLNNPEVEEILPDGAEFMDGLEERDCGRPEKSFIEDQMHETLYMREGDIKRPKSVSHNCGDNENISQDVTNSSCSSRTSFTKRSDTNLAGSVVVTKLPVCSRSKNSLERLSSNVLSCSKLPDVSSQDNKRQYWIQEKANSRPPSGTDVPYPQDGQSLRYARPNSREQYSPNSGSCRPNSRSSSAKSSASSSSQNQTAPRPTSATKTSSHSGLNQKLPRPNSTRLTATAPGNVVLRQPSGKLPPINTASNRTSSRPVSARLSPTCSEPTETSPRPNSGKRSMSIGEPVGMFPHPEMINSRLSFNAPHPLSGGNKLCQLEHIAGDQMIEGVFQKNANVDVNLPHQGDGEHRSEYQIHRKDNVFLDGFPESTLPLPSITKNRTATPPPSFNGNEDCEDAGGEGDTGENDEVSESPCSSYPRAASSSFTKLYDPANVEMCPQSNASPRSENERDHISSQSALGDSANGCQVLENGEFAPTVYEQPSSLSQEVIGHIRQQLYEEGLKPAEREGGVSFFIPVTEDGLQPQSTGDVIKDKLTRSKKASLSYEERMILANINRQMQLSKRKEFAVKDLQNVKGATSSGSDSSDRIKQEDDFDAEFDHCI